MGPRSLVVQPLLDSLCAPKECRSLHVGIGCFLAAGWSRRRARWWRRSAVGVQAWLSEGFLNVVSQAFTALRWNLAVRLVGQALTWGITILVMRLLAPADYGLLAMATVFVEYVATVAELGLGAAIIQAAEVPERRLRAAFGLILLVNGLAALLFFTVAPLIAVFYQEPRLSAIVRTLSLQFLMTAALLVPQSLASRRLDFKSISMVQIGATVLGGLVTVVLAYSGAGVWALVVGNLVAIFLQVIGLNVVSPFLHLPLWSLEESRSLLSFGGSVTGVRVLWAFWSEADILVAGRVLGKDPLGAYAIAKQLASLPLSRIAGIVTQVAFPAFSRLQSDRGALKAHFLRSLQLLAMLAFPITWGISCVAPELIEVVLGQRWLLAVLPLQVLGVVMPIRLLGQFTSAVVQASGRPAVDLRNAVLYTLILPGSFLIGSRAGLLGLTSVWVFIFPPLFFLTTKTSLAAVGVSVRALMRAVALPALAALCMYISTDVTRWLLRGSVGSAGRMPVLVAVGGVAYCGCLLLFDRVGAQSVLRLIRTVLWGDARERT